MLVMYGLIGSDPPSAMRMPPTAETSPKIIASTGTSTGDALIRSADAAGVTNAFVQAATVGGPPFHMAESGRVMRRQRLCGDWIGLRQLRTPESGTRFNSYG